MDARGHMVRVGNDTRPFCVEERGIGGEGESRRSVPCKSYEFTASDHSFDGVNRP